MLAIMMTSAFQQRVRQAFGQAAADYDQAAQLQQVVGEQLLERLACIKLDPPQRVVDLGAGTGRCLAALQQHYPQADCIAIDSALSMLQASGHAPAICADVLQLPLASDSVDLVFSNLMWQWLGDPQAGFAEVRRVLKPGGLFVFTSFGPDTLAELRASWAQVDDEVHVNQFEDMHNLGDQLLAAGLSQPVVDQLPMTVAYDNALGLMKDLRTIGAGQVPARRTGLVTPRMLAQLVDYYQQTYPLADGGVFASYQVIYGHAWAPMPTEHPVHFR